MQEKGGYCQIHNKTVYDFISDLESRKIKLWVDGEALRYKAPKGAVTQEILQGLKDMKDEIIQHLQLEKAKEIFYEPIEQLEEQDYYPLSTAQKRMFLLNQIDNESTAYNITQVLKIQGEFDKNRLEQVIGQLVRRHDSLRTSFLSVDGTLVQRIHQSVDFKLDYGEFEGMEQDIDPLICEFIRPYDLSCAPLFRIKLVKFMKSGDNPVSFVLFDMHHIISDGVSVAILIKEINELYAGKELPEIKVQYKDYAAWHNKLLSSVVVQSQRDYWNGQFQGEIPILNLPADYPRPSTFSFKGDSIKYRLNSEQTDELYRLSRENKVTLYTTLLAAYNVLLAKYTGQEDIIVGAPTAGRRHADVYNTIGMFVNTLAFRNFPQPEKTFEGFLKEVGDKTLEGFDNQDYPFEKLVEDKNIRRDLSRNPIFDTVFILQNMNSESVEIEGMESSRYEYTSRMAQFDITVTAIENKNGIEIEINYCTGIFKRSTMERFSRHFINILEAIARDSTVKLCEIEILTEEEKEQILFDFNNTACGYPREKTIQKLFEEQVDKTPDNIALVFKGEEITYRQLNTRANQLAAVLRKKGVKAGSIAAVMLERSPEMIIGALGILKAGGAYLPIDPDYPHERIQYTLEDSGAAVLLTHKRLAESIKYGGEIIDADDEAVYNGHGSNLPNTNEPSDLAYIIYTSGTTGRPKGVMIEHRNVVRLLFNHKFQFHFSHRDVWTMFHSFCFDFSVWEMYGALLYGGKLIIVPKDTARDTKEYLKLLKEGKVTVLNQTPTAFYNLVREEMNSEGKGLELKYVIFGGEALKPAMLKEWKEKYPEVKLVNMYGITETTVHVTYKEITDYEIENNISNIGRPIPTLTTYIMSGNLKLLPIGVAGELCVGGDGVGQGYLNRPELTAEKFVKNPYNPEERLYRSGDLARLLPHGEMEYLGRIDHQVKIRGHRIELGEIETQLLKHEQVREAVVAAREDINGGSKYLCAYIVSDGVLGIGELRGYLSMELPEYMLPSYFVQLEKMPLTPNGKVDRKSLPEPVGNISYNEEYAAPRNEIEQKLADVWKEILGIERAGINDNFFDLGGDSLKAVKMSAEACKQGINISTSHIFKHRTISNICEAIENREKEDAEREYDSESYMAEPVSQSGDEQVKASENVQIVDKPQSKKLKIEMQRDITTYLHRSLPLCAILAHHKIKPWFYGQYIQIFSVVWETGAMELNYLEHYRNYMEVAPHSVCMAYNMLEKEESILDYVISKINSDYYVVIHLDEYYLEDKRLYKKEHFVHPSLVYGYDNTERKLFAIGFNAEHLFTEINFGYEEFILAYENGKKNYMETAPWAELAAVDLIKPTPHDRVYPFDIMRFLRELHKYLFSTPDIFTMYSMGIPEELVKYGFDVYDHVVAAMEDALQGKPLIVDYRAVHLLYEHKKAIYDRLEYVISTYNLSGELLDMHKEYLKVVEHFNSIRIKTFEFTYHAPEEGTSAQQFRDFVMNTIEAVNSGKNFERTLLLEIYKQLELHFS